MSNSANPYRKLDETIKVYRTLIAQTPNSANLHFLLAKALMDRGADNDAVVSFRHSLSLDPKNAEALARLGHILVKQYHLHEGALSLRRSVELMPQNSRLFFYLFQALHKAGKLEEALAYLNHSAALNPNDLDVLTALLGTKLYSPGYSREQLFTDRRAMGARMEMPWPRKANIAKGADRAKRLRVGFVSGDLGSHPVGFFLEGVLDELRQRDQTDIVIYTTNEMRSDVTDRLRAAAHSWVTIATMPDDVLEKRIRTDKVDILIDLSGHTAFNRLTLFARKPAPIQVTWLGDCATTGLTAIDYIFCDAYGVQPGDEQFYVEKPWHLPNTRLCFTPPREPIGIEPLPALRNDHITFGCFNSLIKMNDTVVALWSRILQRVPASRLMLKSLSFLDANVCAEVKARFTAHGVAAERLEFTLGKERADYFADFNRVDIALDPFPFTGGTTSIDGLWMGIPVITLRGDTMGARQGEGILHNLDMSDWIAENEDAYVELAVVKSQEINDLARLRAELRGRLVTSPLCDAKLFAKNLDDAFRSMWEIHCAEI